MACEMRCIHAVEVTCGDVLQRFSLTREQLDTPCTFENCSLLAEILVKWEPLAPGIGLSEQDITAIQQDHKGDYRAQCSAALAKWRHKFGLRATFLMLAQGLERTKDLEGVEKLCKTFKQVRPLTSSDFSRPSTDSAAAESESLSEKISHFENRFRDLVYDTSEELTGSAEVPLQRLRYDLTLLPLKIKADHVTYIKENLSKLKKADDVTDLFMLLNTYWDHFNYTLLKVLIDLHGSEDLKQRMKTYVFDLQEFWKQTKVMNFINFCKKDNYKLKPWPTAKAPLNFTKLKCVLNKPVTECTLYEVENVRCQFSQGFHLQDFALVLFEIGESSLIITWLIDPVLKTHLKGILVSKENNFLEKLDMKSIFMDGYCIYDRPQEVKILIGQQNLGSKIITYSTVLGRGAFASVYRAKCDELPCAAKILHAIFDDVRTVESHFYQEFQFLKSVHHPNIVQCFGLCQEPTTNRPALLMELMDQSLTNFLESSTVPLSHSVQFRLCHDISLAIAYLHSLKIIHRALSSNNVLLLGPGVKAKVSDFGMSRMIGITEHEDGDTPTMTTGPTAYMPQEALGENPRYTEKLDIFSFGVLVIEILTRRSPDTLPCQKEEESAFSPSIVPVEETECHKDHISLVDKTNPLLDIAIECLSLKMENRPLAKEVCHVIEVLKKSEFDEASVPDNGCSSVPGWKERELRLEEEIAGLKVQLGHSYGAEKMRSEEKFREAEDRFMRAEEESEERLRKAEERARRAEERADDKVREVKERTRRLEEEAEENLREADERARRAEERTRRAEERTRTAEEKTRGAAERAEENWEAAGNPEDETGGGRFRERDEGARAKERVENKSALEVDERAEEAQEGDRYVHQTCDDVDSELVLQGDEVARSMPVPKPRKQTVKAFSASFSGSRNLNPPKPKPHSKKLSTSQLECSSATKPHPVPKPRKQRVKAFSTSFSGSRNLIPPKPKPRSKKLNTSELECSSATKPRPVPKPRKGRVQAKLQEDLKLPGFFLSELPRRETITSKGAVIDLRKEIGVSISISEDTTQEEQTVEIAAGFSGAYEMPEGVQSVSPAYLIKTTEEGRFRKDIDVTLQHNANLETMEDCKEMIFLGANLTPTHTDSDSNPVYRFEEIKGSHVEFSPGKKHGGITLSSLFSLFKIGRKQSGKENKDKEKFYSARLYNAVTGPKVIAVFCMCQDHPTYTKFCDRVISEEYPEISSNKKTRKKTKGALIITASEVELLPEKNTWTIDMDKTTISRKEVDSPERLEIKLSNYPPRIVIVLSPTQKNSAPAVLKVKGLKSEYLFKITYSSHSLLKVDTELLKNRREVFEAEIAAARTIARTQAKSIDQVPDGPMVRCAKNIVEMVIEVEQNIHDLSSLTTLATKVEEIQDLIESVVNLAKGAKNVEDSVIQVSTVSHQLRTVAPAMYKCAAGDPDSWSGPVDVLVWNVINLMKYIGDLLKDTEIASISHGKDLQYKAHAVPTIHDILSPVIKPDGSRYDLSSRISGSWEDIGLRLGLEYNVLHGEIGELRTAKSRLGAVLAIWFEDAPQLPNYDKYPISWEGLHNLLCDSDHSVAAKEFVDFMTEL